MKINEAMKLAYVAMLADEPVFLWGAPGLGKSDLAKKLARMYAESTPQLQLKLDSCNTPDELVKDVRMLLRNIVHLMGLPDIDKTDDKGRTYYSRPADIPTEDEPIVLLVLEELNQAVPSVMAAGYQLVLDRKLGDYKLPDYVRIIATGNRKEDRGATYDMPVPLRDRFGLHLTIEPDRDSFINWAAQNGIRPEIIAWIRWQGHCLLHVAPGSIVNVGDAQITFPMDANAFPTPRRYAKLSKMMDTGKIPSELEADFIGACIGQPIANMFVSFLRIFRQLPNPANVLMNPTTAEVPETSAARWALASALTAHVKEASFSNALKYLTRYTSSTGQVQKEYAIFFVKAATSRNGDLQNTTAFNEFVASNSDIIF